MKKTLIYHLYIPKEGMGDNPIYKVHYFCLKEHIWLFNRVKFTIAVDDLNDTSLINDAVDWIFSILEGTENVEIEYRVVKNNVYGDGRTFYEKIIKNTDDDELIFYFHSKGVASFKNANHSKESIFLWIVLIYYCCLAEYKDVEKALCHTPKTVYGALLNGSRIRPNDFPFIYSGTGMWVNFNGHKRLKEIGVLKDLPLYSKYYGENYYGNFLTFENSYGLESTNHTWFDFEEFGPKLLYNGNSETWWEVIETLNKTDGFWAYAKNIKDKAEIEL